MSTITRQIFCRWPVTVFPCRFLRDMPLGSGRRVYEYDEKTLSARGNSSQDHSFDDYLEILWKRAAETGVFRYTLKELETKVLPGKYKFVAQLNPERALKRRKPQYISDVLQPFNPDIFNFTKIQASEILFEVRPLHWKSSAAQKEGSGTTNLIIANVSPIEHCNSLIVPDVYSCHPQVLSFDALRVVLEIMLLSHNADLKIGFNSLGGHASVNHLHFHMYYLKYHLYLENSPVKRLAGDCYEIIDFPSEGFAFQLVDPNVISVVSNLMKLVSYFLENKIAHNLFITRGCHFETTDGQNIEGRDNFDAIRVFIWARKFSTGAKDDMGFNPALCELAGHLPIKTKEFYDEVTEGKVEAILKDVCHDMFMSVRKDVEKLFTSGRLPETDQNVKG